MAKDQAREGKKRERNWWDPLTAITGLCLGAAGFFYGITKDAADGQEKKDLQTSQGKIESSLHLQDNAFNAQQKRIELRSNADAAARSAALATEISTRKANLDLEVASMSAKSAELQRAINSRANDLAEANARLDRELRSDLTGEEFKERDRLAAKAPIYERKISSYTTVLSAIAVLSRSDEGGEVGRAYGQFWDQYFGGMLLVESPEISSVMVKIGLLLQKSGDSAPMSSVASRNDDKSGLPVYTGSATELYMLLHRIRPQLIQLNLRLGKAMRVDLVQYWPDLKGELDSALMAIPPKP